MLAARNIDYDSIGGIRHDMRREAGARSRQQIEPMPVRRGIGLDHDQPGHAHPRIGERHSRRQPLALRSHIHRREPQRIFLPGDKDQSRVRRRAGRGAPVRFLLPQAICGQVWKPERQPPLR